MPDDETSLDIVIRTRAELEGAESAEAQLDRDIGKARELGQEYAAQEAQSQRARDARAGGMESGEELKRGDEGQATGRAGAETAGQAGAAEPDQQTRREVEAPPTRKTGEQPGREPFPVTDSGGAESREAESAPAGERGSETTDAQEDGEQADTAGVARTLVPGNGDVAGPEFDPAGGRMAGLQAQGIQAAGERMRAALEQNGQMTVALLNRTLELIEQQNRKLEEVERRMEQLGSQIKGLKNP